VANTYAREAVHLTTEQQQENLNRIHRYLATKLADTDRDLKETSRKLVESGTTAQTGRSDTGTLAILQNITEQNRKAESLRFQLGAIDLQISGLTEEIDHQNPALSKAREDLDRALLHYTEQHPTVKKLRAAIAEIEQQIEKQAGQGQTKASFSTGSPASNLYLRVVDLKTQRIGLEKEMEEVSANVALLEKRLQGLPEAQLEYATLNSDYQALKLRRDLLTKSQSDVQFLLENASAPLQVTQWAREEELWATHRQRTAIFVGLAAGALAVLFGSLLVFTVELADGRIRTPRDLARATNLPVLATLGDLKQMTDEEREQWAFRTLTILRGKLGKTGTQPLVCGFISATPGEGRSTWVNLLATAARRYGHRVVVISPPTQQPETNNEFDAGAETTTAPSANPLDQPSEITQQLVLPDAPPVLQLTIPNATWSVEWRQGWHEAVQQWRRMDNLVLFVELPPASHPESVLLSEQVPQLIWLCSRDQVTTTQTRLEMETLRSSHCGLVGSVLNRAAVPAWKRRFAHLSSAAMIALCAVNPTLQAQETVPAAGSAQNIEPSYSLSVSSPNQLAEWQQRLTLGPGDVLNVSIYGEAGTDRPGLVIGPDGRLNYLEAQDVVASGLTVDELRARLDEILGQFHLSAKTVVIPVAYQSKRFFVLGSVVGKGVYPLDRPVTIVEAVAQARGFVSREGLILADLSRSFWIRKDRDGQFARLNVDFEGLFLRGDLTQNLPVAPDDYIYFPPGDSPDVYVVGEVFRPGTLPYSSDLTVMQAIVRSGGFLEVAFQRRVLVVRGSLTRPETFVVDTKDIIDGKEKDFVLEPRDIVYVSRKPWAFASELLILSAQRSTLGPAKTWAHSSRIQSSTNQFL